ncbi:hypothetical protein C7S18_00025 [Ahniella affigens]|uniref:Minimal CRISPR polymerase domain-containing protein n=1 Tax=Ahniella affigens TaxID=2021234 RepID=A0A2P1PLD8_9GAMM|nr:hypothetical protein [Ahniella affigens]AVP95678.1 hypothetical protein C7S18_00025 [Ahniella affigens]
MNTDLYVLGDADQIRDGIDKRLLQGKLEELTAFSSALTKAIASLLQSFEEEMGATVIMAGGDDVLLRVSYERYSLDTNLSLAEEFHRSTGCTISFGVAEKLSDAYINLRKAKAEKSCVCFGGVHI